MTRRPAVGSLVLDLAVELDDQLLFREKHREDALGSLGYQVVRLTWRDLHDPARVERLIKEAFART